jgi:tryptophan-rich sensory protein
MTRSSKPILVAAGGALLVAIAGGSLTKIGPWYRGLEKAELNPPDWAFGPAWTIIYFLCVVAAVVGWRSLKTSRERAWLISLFFINAVLNVLWSAVFFTFQRPDIALAEVITLWLSVLALVIFLSRSGRRGAVYLAPYLIWVAFAAYLNLRTVQLNAPFG